MARKVSASTFVLGVLGTVEIQAAATLPVALSSRTLSLRFAVSFQSDRPAAAELLGDISLQVLRTVSSDHFRERWQRGCLFGLGSELLDDSVSVLDDQTTKGSRWAVLGRL